MYLGYVYNRCIMYQLKVDVDKLNAMKWLWADVLSVSPSSVDTLYVFSLRRRRLILVLTGTSIPLYTTDGFIRTTFSSAFLLQRNNISWKCKFHCPSTMGLVYLQATTGIFNCLSVDLNGSKTHNGLLLVFGRASLDWSTGWIMDTIDDKTLWVEVHIPALAL